MYHVKKCSPNAGAYQNPEKHQEIIEEQVIVFLQQIIILEMSLRKFLDVTSTLCKKISHFCDLCLRNKINC